MKPKVSIIVPIYNGEFFLKRAIKQIKDQIFVDFECICVDDASTDKTREVFNEVAKDDKRFKLVKLNKNGGSSKARNEGLKRAVGEYISFLDVDDDYSKVLIFELYEKAKLLKSDIVVCNFSEFKINKGVIFENVLNNSIFPKKQNFKFSEISKNPKFHLESMSNVVWNKLYKREFLEVNNLEFSLDLKRAEDIEFNLRALVLAGTISYIPKSLYTYNTGFMNSNVSTLDKYPFDIFNAMTMLRKFFIKNNIESEYHELLIKMYCDHIIGFMSFYMPETQRKICSNGRRIFKDLGINEIPIKNHDILLAIYNNDFDRYLIEEKNKNSGNEIIIDYLKMKKSLDNPSINFILKLILKYLNNTYLKLFKK